MEGFGGWLDPENDKKSYQNIKLKLQGTSHDVLEIRCFHFIFREWVGYKMPRITDSDF